MADNVHNEITVRLTREPNSAPIYQVMYGRICILKLLSVPSDDDIKLALSRFRESSNTSEPESARVAQLRGKHRMGKWTGDDDDLPPRAA